MIYASDLLKSLVPITRFNRGQSSEIFNRLPSEKQIVVLRGNLPVAVLVSVPEFDRLCGLEKRFDEMENDIYSLSSQVDAYREDQDPEMTKLRERVSELSSRCYELETKLKEDQEELNDWKGRCLYLQEQVEILSH